MCERGVRGEWGVSECVCVFVCVCVCVWIQFWFSGVGDDEQDH